MCAAPDAWQPDGVQGGRERSSVLAPTSTHRWWGEQLCRVGTPQPKTTVQHARQPCNAQTSACPWGVQRFGSPKKVPGLTRPPSRRFAWAFSGLGRPASGMCASQLPADELEADADEGGRECLPVVVTTARPPAAGGAPCVPSSQISADVPPAGMTTTVVAATAGRSG